jgi:hypothetical protein
MTIERIARDYGSYSYADPSDDPSTGTSDESSATSLLAAGDLGAQMAALVIQNAKSQRDANHQLRDAQEHALLREEAAQIQAMHEKADDTRAAGWVKGGAGMLSGGFTIGGSFGPAQSEVRTRWNGASQIVEGFGSGFGGMAEGAIADDETRAKSHEHAAGFYERSLNATRESLRESQDLLERVIDFYKAYEQGQADATKTSVGR